MTPVRQRAPLAAWSPCRLGPLLSWTLPARLPALSLTSDYNRKPASPAYFLQERPAPLKTSTLCALSALVNPHATSSLKAPITYLESGAFHCTSMSI